MAAPVSNPQAVKFIQQSRTQVVSQFIQAMNLLQDSINEASTLQLDGAKAPTQADFDAVNQAAQNSGIYGPTFVPVTQASWDAWVYAARGMVDAWTGGQDEAFLNYRQ